MANLIDPYSILNPETSSDSPSAKSKGVRFSSAIHVILQRSRRGLANAQTLSAPRGDKVMLILLLFQKEKRATHKKARLISYAIVCATPRNPPSLAYFLPDPQPAPIRG